MNIYGNKISRKRGEDERNIEKVGILEKNVCKSTINLSKIVLNKKESERNKNKQTTILSKTDL